MLISELEGAQRRENMKTICRIKAGVGRESLTVEGGTKLATQRRGGLPFPLLFLEVLKGNW